MKLEARYCDINGQWQSLDVEVEPRPAGMPVKDYWKAEVRRLSELHPVLKDRTVIIREREGTCQTT